MPNANLSEFMRDHIDILQNHLDEAKDDSEAAGAICNAFVFIMRKSGIDPHEWVKASMSICDKIEAEQAANCGGPRGN